VPWIFSLAPSDDVLAGVLAQAIAATVVGRERARTTQPTGADNASTSVCMISCTDHDSRMFAAELVRALQHLSITPVGQVEFRPGETELGKQLDRLAQSAAKSAVVIAGARDSANVLAALRRREPTLSVFGGPMMGRKLFAETAGLAAEGVRFPLLWHETAAGERSRVFRQRFIERCGIEPDYTAAYSYDAVNLLTTAIRRAGLNRVLIRDAIRELSPWDGVTGRIEWDPTGQNRGQAMLGMVHAGRIMPADGDASSSGLSR
jgi:ABC-type branched-subunit amino acid transport system substrate-binding protein